MTVNELINKLKQLPQFGNDPVGIRKVGSKDGFQIEGIAFIRHPISEGGIQYVVIEYRPDRRKRKGNKK